MRCVETDRATKAVDKLGRAKAADRTWSTAPWRLGRGRVEYFWVETRHAATLKRCPLYPSKQDISWPPDTFASCQRHFTFRSFGCVGMQTLTRTARIHWPTIEYGFAFPGRPPSCLPCPTAHVRFGSKLTFRKVQLMSPLPPKADIG